MAGAILRRGKGSLRPLVVSYFAGSRELIDAVSDHTCVVGIGDSSPGFFRSASTKNPLLNDLIEDLLPRVGAEAFFPIVLMGFSAGCQAVRMQLIAEQFPTATLTVDGVHSSLPPQSWQIDVWRRWFEKCGADVPTTAPNEASGSDGRPVAIVTLTQIVPPTFTGTRATMEAVTGWDLPPGTKTDPGRSQSGNLIIYSYPGGQAEAHLDQARRVLPAKLRELAECLGFAPGDPPTPGQSVQPCGRKSGGSLVGLLVLALASGAVWWLVRK
jgi:hypothetical protein